MADGGESGSPWICVRIWDLYPNVGIFVYVMSKRCQKIKKCCRMPLMAGCPSNKGKKIERFNNQCISFLTLK